MGVRSFDWRYRSTGEPAARALVALGWAVTVVLAFFALMRVVAWDAIEAFAIVNALTAIVYLPAWIVAISAAVGRRWLLAGGAVVVVAAQFAYELPELLYARPIPSWAQHASTIRLLDANVDKSEQFRFGYGPAITRYRPDVVTLEEFTPGSLRHLLRTGSVAVFPYRCVEPRYGAIGFLIASRIPMTECRVHSVMWNDKPTPYMVSATLHTRDGPVQLRVVHTLAPLPSSWSEWVAALKAIDSTVRVAGREAMLMVGDFNATWNNQGFATLLSYGLSDAAAARARAFEMTWPSGAIVPSFVRIDHVLTGSSLAVTKIDTYSGFGSDHRYLTASVAVHPR